MSEFRSLYAALKGWYCKPLADYPLDLRVWIAGWRVPLVNCAPDIPPAYPGGYNWDRLTPAQRINFAKQWDSTTKKERDELDRFYAEYEELQKIIADYENADAPTVLDMVKREEILTPLKAKFTEMGLKHREMRGDLVSNDATEISQAMEKTEPLNRVVDVASEKPWLIHAEGDPPPEQPWYTPARYFARGLVKENSTLLTKRDSLASKVAQSLSNAGFKKRGGKKPLSSGTVKKALNNVVLG